MCMNVKIRNRAAVNNSILKYEYQKADVLKKFREDYVKRHPEGCRKKHWEKVRSQVASEELKNFLNEGGHGWTTLYGSDN